MPTDNSGGSGGEYADGPNTRDTRLAERALSERWPMSPSVRVAVLKRLCAIIDKETTEGKRASPREVIAAARALLAADRLNLAQLVIDLRANGNGEFDLSQLVAEAEKIAETHVPAAPPADQPK